MLSRTRRALALVASLGLAVLVNAHAQVVSGSPSGAELPALPEVATEFELDPAQHGLTAFVESSELYGLLTQEGRCPPNKMAAVKQPCALVLYVRVDENAGGPRMTFKPVFKVISRGTIWAIHDKALKKVRIENLYFDEPEIKGRPKVRYRSIAVVGNAENTANCEQMRPCLSSLVADDMFLMYNRIPDTVAAILWETRTVDQALRRPQ